MLDTFQPGNSTVVEQSIMVSGEMPASSAATSVKVLNDEPAWRPDPPRPVARFTWLV